jgi:choline dehydrogenase-like flavoprotein
LADGELQLFERSPFGEFLTGHRVARLVTTDGESIAHAEVQTPSGERRSIRARCFVVAAGVIESPRLLLLSRSKWFPDGLGNRSGLVGCNFVEHPSFAWHFTPQRRLDASEGSHRSYALNDWARRHGMNAYHCQLEVDTEPPTTLKMQPEVEPRIENRVMLDPEAKDAFGDPAPLLSFSYSERDRKTIAQAEKFYPMQAESMGADPNGARRRQGWRAHPSGTCRMAHDEAKGVVDENNRVFGMTNLYVSGACTFPTPGTANPTLTVVALTLRLSDHLASVLRA